MGIATQFIVKGKVKDSGVIMPAFAFDPTEIFKELEKRQILVHEKVERM